MGRGKVQPRDPENPEPGVHSTTSLGQIESLQPWGSGQPASAPPMAAPSPVLPQRLQSIADTEGPSGSSGMGGVTFHPPLACFADPSQVPLVSPFSPEAKEHPDSAASPEAEEQPDSPVSGSSAPAEGPSSSNSTPSPALGHVRVSIGSGAMRPETELVAVPPRPARQPDGPVRALSSSKLGCLQNREHICMPVQKMMSGCMEIRWLAACCCTAPAPETTTARNICGRCGTNHPQALEHVWGPPFPNVITRHVQEYDWLAPALPAGAKQDGPPWFLASCCLVLPWEERSQVQQARLAEAQLNPSPLSPNSHLDILDSALMPDEACSTGCSGTGTE